MKQNVNPVVVAIAIIAALALIIKFGWSSLGPQHETVKEPFDMGKVMKGNMAPPPETGPKTTSPAPTGTTP